MFLIFIKNKKLQKIVYNHKIMYSIIIGILNKLICFGILLIPFIFYIKPIQTRIRLYDTLLFQFLVKKKLFFGTVFNLLKIFFFVYFLYTFAGECIEFFKAVCRLEDDALYLALISFVLLQLGLLFHVKTIVFSIFSRKFVFVDEIFKIFILNLIVAFLVVCAEELGHTALQGLFKYYFNFSNSGENPSSSEKNPSSYEENSSSSGKNPNSYGENPSSSAENPSNFTGPSTVVEPTILKPTIVEPTVKSQNDYLEFTAEPVPTNEPVSSTGPIWAIRTLAENTLFNCKESIHNSPEPEAVKVCHRDFPAPTEQATEPSQHHNSQENKHMACGFALLVAETFGMDIDNLERKPISVSDIIPRTILEDSEDFNVQSPSHPDNITSPYNC